MTAAPSDRDSRPVVLADGAVSATAGFIAADRSASWIDPHLSGVLALPCYVLRSGQSALIVDSGLAVHWDTIRSGLDHALAGTLDRSLIMTRREPDAIGNLPGIVRCFDLQAVYCGGVISPLDFFERVDAISTSEHLQAIAQSDVTWIRPGAQLVVGNLCLEVLPTTLRVLPKHHLYEQSSRTLFGSDTWGFIPQATQGEIEVVRDWDERLSVSAIARHLLHRFEWLAGVDTSPMQAEVDKLSSYPIDRICSSYGCIIEGSELVATVLRDTIVALQGLSRQDRVKRMDRRVRDKIKAAIAVSPASMHRFDGGGAAAAAS